MVNFTSRVQSFPHLYRGIVKINEDPKSLGRCKIHIPDIYGLDDYNVNMLPWARPITISPYTNSKGSFNIPDVGDVVWVFLEGGNKSAPVYFGGTVGSSDTPIDPNQVVLYREEESTLYYDRSSKKFTVRVKDTSLEISEDGVIMNGAALNNGGSSGGSNVPGIQYEILEVIEDVHSQ